MAILNTFEKDYVEIAQNLGAVGGFAKFTFHNKMLKSSSNEKKKVIESIIHPTSDTKITLQTPCEPHYFCFQLRWPMQTKIVILHQELGTSKQHHNYILHSHFRTFFFFNVIFQKVEHIYIIIALQLHY